MKKIGLACDHAGYPLKEQVKEWLTAMDYEFVDFGTHSTESCNYPEFAHALANAIENGEFEKADFWHFCGFLGVDDETVLQVIRSPGKQNRELAQELRRLICTMMNPPLPVVHQPEEEIGCIFISPCPAKITAIISALLVVLSLACVIFFCVS